VIFLWNTLRKEHWIQQTINPLNSSNTSTTLSWYGHVDQQDYSNFFTTSTALELTMKFTMEVEANDTLPFMDVLVMKKGPNLSRKCTANLLVQVVISISNPTTYIT
jgi:hypothetical protein